MNFLIYYFEEYSYRDNHAVWWVFGVALFIFWVWSAVYVANQKVEDQTRKICWLLIVLFLGPLGSLLYFLFGIESTNRPSKEKDPFKRWVDADSSRAYLSKEDQLEAFKSQKKS